MVCTILKEAQNGTTTHSGARKSHHKGPHDFNIHTDKVIHHRRPDIVVVNSAVKTVEIINVAIPGDKRVQEKETFHHYTDLKIEL